MTETAGTSPIPAVENLGYLPEVLTAAGIARIFGKAKNTVSMAIYTGKLPAYRDGRIILIATIDAMALWGVPAIVRDYEIRD